MSAAVAVADANGRLVEAGLAFAELLRRDVHDIVGKTFLELTHEDDRDENRHLVRALLAGEIPAFTIEKRYLRGDGRPVWVRNSVTAVRDEAGRPFRIVAVVEDLARLRDAQSLLRGQTEVLERLAAGAPPPDVLDLLARFIERHAGGMRASILVLDEDGRHLRHGAAPSLPPAYNRAIDGVEIGEAVGSCGTAAHRRDAVVVQDVTTDPLWANYLDLAREHRLRACWSTPILSTTGELLGTFALYYSEPRAPSGRDRELIALATHLAGVAMERWRDDARLRRLNAELEHRVLERTRQLASANRELETFSYTVAHDLRAPLRGARALLEEALDRRDERLPSDVAANLLAAQTAHQRMDALIQDILALALVSHHEPDRARVNVSALAEAIRADLAAREPSRSVDVRVQPGIVADADPRLLRIALENLFANAWKFTRRAREPRIEVGARRDDGEVVLFVRDNGAGFDMRRSDRLFQAFQRLHPTAEFEGTGIGLSTVRRIVERHGGRAWAEGEPGKGATFHLTLGLDGLRVE